MLLHLCLLEAQVLAKRSSGCSVVDPDLRYTTSSGGKY